ncbi:VOC family protein [Microlunatus elymi]|uniref:hypothetical protein n=1 Tax=Microlunatus elymi TaxID=2596828 RepID=UPI001D1892D7|nr:hypothetical protein [Microlunatus elymi]
MSRLGHRDRAVDPAARRAELAGRVRGRRGEVDHHGGRSISPPVDIPVGRVAVVADPFGNRLVLPSKGRYDPGGEVRG